MKGLFAIPEGKITEKVFCKVLAASLCGILLCMACIAGSAWAWFVVSVENTENVIQIATVTADVTVSRESATVSQTGENQYGLQAGTYDVHIQLESDRTNPRTVYILVTVGEGEQEEKYAVAMENGSVAADLQLHIAADQTAVAFRVSWVIPENTQPVNDTIGTPPSQQEETPPETPETETTPETT